MEKNYEVLYRNAKENYERLLSDYLALTDTPAYRNATLLIPMALLEANYLNKRLAYYTAQPKGQSLPMHFRSIQDAYATYIDITHYEERVGKLLDDAAVIVEADNMAKRINDYVALSDFLNPAQAVERNEFVTSAAKELVKAYPATLARLTPSLIHCIQRDILSGFDGRHIMAIQARGFVSADDIDTLTLICNTAQGKENLEMIRASLGLQQPAIKKAEIHAKGVTFPNPDGSSRQEYLKELDEYVKTTKEKPSLTLIPYTYYPELGDPEAAVKILWGDREIGNLPKDVAIQIHGEYADKVLSATLVNVVGGGDKDMSYGLILNLEVREPVKEDVALEC